LPLSPTAQLTPRRRCQSRHRSWHNDHIHPSCSPRTHRLMSAILLTFPRLFIQLPDRNSGFIMSICFTICPSVSLLLLLLVFNYCSSRNDGATHIVSMSHALLCTRLILSSRHLHFFYLLAAALLHIYDHLFFWGSYVRFPFGLTLAFAFCLSLSLDHGTYKHKPS